MKRKFCFATIEMETDVSLSKKVALVERNASPNGIPLINTKLVAKRAPNDLIELAMEIQKADEFISATTCNKLQFITEQVRFLQNQAQKILIEAKQNSDLHHAACNFKKVPGNIYYLYKRPSGQIYFSMLSPQEWTNHPHEFLGGYRLESDHSWTPETNIEQKNSQISLINKIMTVSETVSSPLSLALQETSMDCNS